MKIDKKQKTIDALKRRLKGCKAYRLSSTRNNIIVGEGDLDARLMLIALSPGEKEDTENRMFVGPSGQILNKLFDTAEIDRGSVYMTNLIKCILPKNRRPKMDEIESCRPFLDAEITIVGPEIIVPLGYYVTRKILTKYHADPPAARTDFTKLYGTLIFSDDQTLFPLPHPASLLYNPSFEPETIEKYKKLKILLHDCKWYHSCPMKWFYEEGRLERTWIELYCKGDWKNCVRYEMEAQSCYHPDWMLPDGSMDERLKKL